jgi:adenylate kinase
MNIALIGPSGSGKGTQVALVGRDFNLAPIDTGGILRENLARKSALGLLARKYMNQGELVPDEVVDAMVESALLAVDRSRGIAFDGFPRTVYQARFLDELLAGMGRTLDAAIFLQLSPETALRRTTGRFLCERCHAPFHAEFHPPAQAGVCDLCQGPLYRRPEDNPDFAQVRLRAFQRATSPLLDFYRSSDRLAVVNAEGDADFVFRAIGRSLAAIARHEPLAPLPDAAVSTLLPKLAPVPPPRLAAPMGDGFVLVGGPGSGKGTQAEKLCDRRDLQHVATGDLFRDNLKRQTDLGKLAKTYMDRGELVPDDVTDAMVQERLARADTAAGFVLDGYPRTIHQAEALADILEHLGRHLAGVICIQVSDQEIVDRLSGRLVCRNCQTPYHQRFKPPARPGICDRCGGPLYQRDDDNPATVRARLKTFHGQTGPLIEFYRQAGLFAEVPGEGDVAQVTALTLAAAQTLGAERAPDTQPTAPAPSLQKIPPQPRFPHV